MKPKCRIEVYLEDRKVKSPAWVQEHGYDLKAARRAGRKIISERNGTVRVHIVDALTGELIERVMP